MKHEFVVWTDRTRLPTIADIMESLKSRGYECRVSGVIHGKSDPSSWVELNFETEVEGAALMCHVVTSVPSTQEIEQMRETYELLPFQLKNASRRFKVTSENDTYGQTTPFHAQVVATLALLSKGVIDDPQEGGLMLLEEFQAYMSF